MNKRVYVFFLMLFIASLVFGQTITGIDSATISFKNPALGFQAELEGLLQWPKAKGKYPVVVFIHGSGKGTRYEYNSIFSLFLEKGYAVFSYDKRGVHRSGGTYYGVGPKNSSMMIPLLASDAYEGIEAISRLPQIDSTQVILFGGSQAGWIIPVVADMSRSVSHYVSLYGPTVSVGEEIYFSRYGENGEMDAEQATNMLKGFRGFRGFDPLPYLSKIQQKGLWIFGGRDVSVPTQSCLHLLDSLDKKNPRPNTIKVYPKAGHGLINPTTGLAEDYLPFVLEWMDQHIKK